MLHCRIAARASALDRVRRRAEDAARNFGLDQAERFEFVFAVNEAVTNAIRHGRPFQDGTIELRIDTCGDTLVCAVSDGGRLEAISVTPDEFAESGRGIAAMTRLTDQVELVSCATGTTIRLHKRRRDQLATDA